MTLTRHAIGSGRAQFILPGDRFINAPEPLEHRSILDMTIQAAEPLPERLRRLALSLETEGEYPPHVVSDLQESADTIEANQARIAELEAALKPFARIAEMETRAEDGASVMVNVSRCRDARAALSIPS
jgi:hypothetical protein